MKRKIVKIDEEKCNGCGLCIPNCHEGALQIIDEKARLISDLFCDGLGACLGHCPEDAITIEERNAEPYDERIVMSNMIKQGPNTVNAHLKHLKDHNEMGFYNQALDYLKENGIVIAGVHQVTPVVKPEPKSHCGCPGSKTMDFNDDIKETNNSDGKNIPSELRQWPIQLHLVGTRASYFQNADVLLAADCTGYAMGSFHQNFMKGKAIAIACPKLDSDQEEYIQKITTLIDEAHINTLTVVIMEVPCCGGLLRIAQMGAEKASRKIPIKLMVMGIKGEIIEDTWV